jgi:NAD/NADP transhydrogenase alpha subunit
MKIGIPKEIHPGEKRVATTPEVDHQYFCRQNFTSSGNLAGKKSVKMLCSFDNGTVARNIGHRA